MRNNEAVIKEYLGRESEGALLVNVETGIVDWTPDNTVTGWEEIVLVEAAAGNHKCDCGEYYNDECDTCLEQFEYLLNQINEIITRGGK